MPTYLEIAVNVPQVTGVFHYHAPAALDGRLQVGHLVEAPFGKQRVQGVVLRFVPRPSVPETRPVLALVDPLPVVTRAQIRLAEHLAQTTLAPLSVCIGLMLPPGLSQQVDTLYETKDGGRTTVGQRRKTKDERRTTEDPSSFVLRPPSPDLRPSSIVHRPLSELQTRLLSLLEKRGPLRGRQIDQALPRLDWRGAARSLVQRGLISSRPVLPPPAVQPKVVRTVQLACPPERAEASLDELGRPGSPALARRQAVLRYLLREPGPVEVTWVYAESGGNLSDLRKLADLGLVLLGESEVWRDPLKGMDFQPTRAPVLTQDQQRSLAEVLEGLQQAAAGQAVPPLLLHGVTGSGKTEIYLNAVAEVLRLGKQALILVPEIALTPQTVRRFISRFPGRVGLVHSGLSPGERYDTWRRARAGELGVVVGPRSALFTPLADLGLIVLDEFHDDSYSQSEPPFYHARQAGIAYAHLAGAVCLLGSATPDVASAYHASQGDWRYLRLPSRILAHRDAVRGLLDQAGAGGLRGGGGEAGGEAPAGPEPGRTGDPADEDTPLQMELPPVRVVDMRQELQAGNRSIFSRALQAALERVLRQGRQAILFLNRRGTATYVFCRDCGYTLKCPHCELPLTYHARTADLPIFNSPDSIRPGTGAQGRADAPAGQQIGPPAHDLKDITLLCHHCGYQRKMPRTCPDCGGSHIRQYGAGTERVEAEVLRLFPKARTLRWDYETTRHKGAHEVILSHFAAHRADVLVGTQMLAKGLDLPLVTLVGVVLADVGLNLPDVFAAERTFQLLTQVAGRAGRSLLGGEVVLQTFQPDHYVIQAAAGHNYRAFYRQELEYRRRLGYPPFARLVRLEYRHPDPFRAESAARDLAGQIQDWIVAEERRATEMIGPAPCFFARVGGQYRWQIVLRGPDPASLLANHPLADWRVEVDPASLL